MRLAFEQSRQQQRHLRPVGVGWDVGGKGSMSDEDREEESDAMGGRE